MSERTETTAQRAAAFLARHTQRVTKWRADRDANLAATRAACARIAERRERAVFLLGEMRNAAAINELCERSNSYQASPGLEEIQEASDAHGADPAEVAAFFRAARSG